MIVAIFRPQPDADDTAEKIRALGHTAILAPSGEITLHPLNPADFDPETTLLLTSRNAVRALSKSVSPGLLSSIHALCTGAQTHESAVAAGLKHARLIEGSAECLPMAAKAIGCAQLCYLRGRDVSFDLAAPLEAFGIACTQIEAYAVDGRSRWSEAEIAELGTMGGGTWLHFSPNQAEKTIHLAHKADIVFTSPKRHICLSPRIANSLHAAAEMVGTRLKETDVQSATEPQLQELLALLGPATAH